MGGDSCSCRGEAKAVGMGPGRRGGGELESCSSGSCSGRRCTRGKWLYACAVLLSALAVVGPVDARREVTVSYRLLNLKELLGFVSDSTPHVPSDSCPETLTIDYRSRDDLYVDPAVLGLQPSCDSKAPRRLWKSEDLCSDLTRENNYCSSSSCDEMETFAASNRPFSSVSSRFFFLNEQNYTKDRSLSVFLMEDVAVGNCWKYLEAVQGDQPRRTNSTGTRTLLSGDIMVVRVHRQSTTESECLYVAEDRKRDDRFRVSHRVRVEDGEFEEVEGTEQRFQQLWAAKLGLWDDSVRVEFVKEVHEKTPFLVLRARKISHSKASILASTVTRSDVLGVVIKVRPSFAQSFSPDGHLWYRVDGGRMISVVLGGWKKVGTLDWTALLLAVACIVPVAMLTICFTRRWYKIWAHRSGYMVAPSEDRGAYSGPPEGHEL